MNKRHIRIGEDVAQLLQDHPTLTYWSIYEIVAAQRDMSPFSIKEIHYKYLNYLKETTENT